MTIARIAWKTVEIAHLQLPPRHAGGAEALARPGAIAVGFNGQQDAVVMLASGRTAHRRLPPGTVGMTGGAPVQWLRTGRSDVVEIAASAALRSQVAVELRVEAHADLADLHGWDNAQCQAIASRFRAAARGQHPLGEVEADAFARRLYAIALMEKFGGRLAERSRAPLDQRRLRRVLDFIQAELDSGTLLAETLCLDRLAGVAGYSPFHFARAFKAVTGWAPHRFVTIRRLECARQRLLDGHDSVQMIALDLGYANLGHFRRQFQAHTGYLPAAFRAS